MTLSEKTQSIQRYLGITVDGVYGPQTADAIIAKLGIPVGPPKETLSPWRKVKASSFADPKDVVAFKRCKAQGKTDQECFKVGDNGVGAWGHDTTDSDHPMAALPRDIWKEAGKTGGARLEVRINNLAVEGILGDTMPPLANIKNGAGIDLNPGFQRAFGIEPPFLVSAEWRWV